MGYNINTLGNFGLEEGNGIIEDNRCFGLAEPVIYIFKLIKVSAGPEAKSADKRHRSLLRENRDGEDLAFGNIFVSEALSIYAGSDHRRLWSYLKDGIDDAAIESISFF